MVFGIDYLHYRFVEKPMVNRARRILQNPRASEKDKSWAKVFVDKGYLRQTILKK